MRKIGVMIAIGFLVLGVLKFADKLHRENMRDELRAEHRR